MWYQSKKGEQIYNNYILSPIIIFILINFCNDIEQSASQISVISDVVEEISKEIKDASKKYTYVITSGGIGPTHDDVTYEGKYYVKDYQI